MHRGIPGGLYGVHSPIVPGRARTILFSVPGWTDREHDRDLANVQKANSRHAFGRSIDFSVDLYFSLRS